jgi:hypothetical protein
MWKKVLGKIFGSKRGDIMGTVNGDFHTLYSLSLDGRAFKSETEMGRTCS